MIDLCIIINRWNLYYYYGLVWIRVFTQYPCLPPHLFFRNNMVIYNPILYPARFCTHNHGSMLRGYLIRLHTLPLFWSYFDSIPRTRYFVLAEYLHHQERNSYPLKKRHCIRVHKEHLLCGGFAQLNHSYITARPKYRVRL